jgi:putative transposase
MAHSYTNLLYHIVYATKERRPLIDDEFQPRLYDYIGGAIRELKSTSLEIGGVEDHVHILAKLPPTIAVADFLEKLDPPISLEEIWSAIQKSLWPAAYTHFRGLRSIRIPDAVVDTLLSLRPRALNRATDRAALTAC